MANQQIFLVQVEFCKNCSLHSSNTRHDEAKYAFYFEQVKKLVEQNSSNQILVHAMIPPEDLVPSNMLEGDNTFLNKRTGALEYFPNLGAFEVYVNQILISSKILSNKWPNIDYLVNTILEMYLKNKNDKDLSEYEVGKRVVEKPKHKTRIDPPIYRQNLQQQYRIKQYEKNLIKKQQEFYDHYIKMSKTIDYGRINNHEQRYANVMQITPMDAVKYQSVNLNPEVRNRSVGMDKRHSFKASSKAQKRLNAYSNSVDRRELFFPTIDLNEAYNPTIEPIQQALNKKRESITLKQSRGSQRRQLVKDLRKDALEQALALEQEKVEIEEKLIKFYEKHQNLFDTLKNSRKAVKITPNLQKISKDNKLDSSMTMNQKSEQKIQPKIHIKKETSSQLEAIEQRYLNEVMKSQDPENSEGRFATQEKQQSVEVRRPTKIINKSELSDKKDKSDPRRKLVEINKTKQARASKEPKQEQATKVLRGSNAKIQGQKSPAPKIREEKDFQKWISKQLKQENKIQEKDLVSKSREMDDSLIHHLNDLNSYENLTSEEGFREKNKEKKVPEKKENVKKAGEVFQKVQQKSENKTFEAPQVQTKNRKIEIVSTTNIKIQSHGGKGQKPKQQEPKPMKNAEPNSNDTKNAPQPKEKGEKQNPAEICIKITNDKKTDQSMSTFEKKGNEYVNEKEEKVVEANKKEEIKEKSKIESIETHSEELYRKQQKEQALTHLAGVMKEKEKVQTEVKNSNQPVPVPVQKAEPKPQQKKSEPAPIKKQETQKVNEPEQKKIEPQKACAPVETKPVVIQPPQKQIFKPTHMKINTITAKFTKNFDTFGSMQPFLVFRIGKNEDKTEVFEGSYESVEWKKSIELPLGQESTLQILGYDEGVTENEYIGKASIKFRELPLKAIHAVQMMENDDLSIGKVFFNYEITGVYDTQTAFFKPQTEKLETETSKIALKQDQKSQPVKEVPNPEPANEIIKNQPIKEARKFEPVKEAPKQATNQQEIIQPVKNVQQSASQLQEKKTEEDTLPKLEAPKKEEPQQQLPKQTVSQHQASKQVPNQQETSKQTVPTEVPKQSVAQAQVPKQVITQPETQKQQIIQPEITKKVETQPEVPKQTNPQPEATKQVISQPEAPKQMITQAEVPKQPEVPEQNLNPVESQKPAATQPKTQKGMTQPEAPKQMAPQLEPVKQQPEALKQTTTQPATQPEPQKKVVTQPEAPKQTVPQPETQKQPEAPKQIVTQPEAPKQIVTQPEAPKEVISAPKPLNQSQQPAEPPKKQITFQPAAQKARYEPKFEDYRPSNEPVSMITKEEINQMMSQNRTKKFLLEN